jgi:hypothetical protein
MVLDLVIIGLAIAWLRLTIVAFMLILGAQQGLWKEEGLAHGAPALVIWPEPTCRVDGRMRRARAAGPRKLTSSCSCRAASSSCSGVPSMPSPALLTRIPIGRNRPRPHRDATGTVAIGYVQLSYCHFDALVGGLGQQGSGHAGVLRRRGHLDALGRQAHRGVEADPAGSTGH